MELWYAHSSCDDHMIQSNTDRGRAPFAVVVIALTGHQLELTQSQVSRPADRIMAPLYCRVSQLYPAGYTSMVARTLAITDRT